MASVRLGESALLYWLLYSEPQPSESMARTDGVGLRQRSPQPPTTSTEVSDRHGLDHFDAKPLDHRLGQGPDESRAP